MQGLDIRSCCLRRGVPEILCCPPIGCLISVDNLDNVSSKLLRKNFNGVLLYVILRVVISACKGVRRISVFHAFLFYPFYPLGGFPLIASEKEGGCLGARYTKEALLTSNLLFIPIRREIN